uniref:Uncharacterized protein n=1 Tax=Romanomermis culicivorax TaxID=13658 RepID=A0A915ISI9_ROMCU
MVVPDVSEKMQQKFLSPTPKIAILLNNRWKMSKSYNLIAKQKILIEEGNRFFLVQILSSDYGWTLIKENKINDQNSFDLVLYSIRLCHDDRSARLVLKNNLKTPLPASSIGAKNQFLYIVRFSDPLMNIFDSAKNVWHEKRIGLFHKEHAFAGNAQWISVVADLPPAIPTFMEYRTAISENLSSSNPSMVHNIMHAPVHRRIAEWSLSSCR